MTDPTGRATARRALLTVCDRAACGRDLGDPAQLAAAAAAADAAVVLDALGLLGDHPRRLSPGEGKIRGAAGPHGSRPAVQAHLRLGQGLCVACRRWAEVNERRTGEPAPADPASAPKVRVAHPDAPEPTADGHGTWRAWRAHRDGGEVSCGPCAAYLEWWSARRRKSRWGAP